MPPNSSAQNVSKRQILAWASPHLLWLLFSQRGQVGREYSSFVDRTTFLLNWMTFTMLILVNSPFKEQD